MNATTDDSCRGCSATVRLAAGEVQRLLADYLSANPAATIVDDATYAHRMNACGTCPDLKYGTTCRHCGCLVAVRAKLAGKACPAVMPVWNSA
ncbi:MAG TPA: DUF6171 family protein [Tepidisphaeraceae bacterium]|jgi:hypothetical protein|nr:DUF6171 family protein [Tepidisphaeraceae bacterium]